LSSLRTRAARVHEASPASRAGVALAIMLGAQLMIILDATVVNIALPQVYGFVRAAASGWGDHLVLGSFGAAVALLAAFVAVEARARQPIAPFRLFADVSRSSSFVARLLLIAGMFGVFYFLTQLGSRHHPAQKQRLGSRPGKGDRPEARVGSSGAVFPECKVAAQAGYVALSAAGARWRVRYTVARETVNSSARSAIV